ncbi:hypothetical protein GCM10008960_00950 [Deinococcus sedimenti]|uniref:Uncharacterized protein n=1 Tax=Deinococcus sedimenti TaxID=1867090 RepID=A0ABQ2S074_9DEIO|nr:hypothetical protein GCM10008960_00950 [Deinococcus sedimenti]
MHSATIHAPVAEDRVKEHAAQQTGHREGKRDVSGHSGVQLHPGAKGTPQGSPSNRCPSQVLALRRSSSGPLNSEILRKPFNTSEFCCQIVRPLWATIHHPKSKGVDAATSTQGVQGWGVSV